MDILDEMEDSPIQLPQEFPVRANFDDYRIVTDVFPDKENCKQNHCYS